MGSDVRGGGDPLPMDRELLRIPSWKEMHDVAGSVNSSTLRPPYGPIRVHNPPIKVVERSSSLPKSTPPAMEPEAMRKDTGGGEKENSQQPLKREDAMKIKARPERFNQIVNPSSLNVNNAQLALYIAMAHAGLVLGILVICFIGLLLKGYWKPIQWAVLISMPLREIQSLLVSFWQEPLQAGILETILAIPAFILKNLAETGYDAREAISSMSGMMSKGSPSMSKKKIGFAKLSRWLLTFAVCTVMYDFLGSVVFVSTVFVGLLLYAGMTTVWPLFETNALRSPTLKGKPGNSLTRIYKWTIQPIVDALRWSNRGVTRSLAAKLPTVVAIVLILLMIVGFLGGSILFTYKVGMEAKDAIITLKIHVDHSNYAETIGLNKWVEENNVTQQIDSYMSQAYEALLEQIDVFAAKNNMTEAVKVGKQFLSGIMLEGKVAGVYNGTESTSVAVPSHPLVERLQNIKAKLRTYDLGGAYAEGEAAAGLGLELFQLRQDDLIERGKQATQKISDIGKTLVLSGSSLMGKCFYLVLSFWSSMASGAVGLINFITETIIFFSVLYYLITSESGGVMNQVLNMVQIGRAHV